MRIRYSPAAREDLRELRRYLVGEFGAAVADEAVRKIVIDISMLKRHPGLLRPLADKIGLKRTRISPPPMTRRRSVAFKLHQFACRPLGYLNERRSP